MGWICSAGDGNYPRFTGEHPYEGKLRHGDALALGMLLDEMHKRHVVLQCLGRELRKVPTAVALLETAVLVDGASEECTTQRTVGHETDA